MRERESESVYLCVNIICTCMRVCLYTYMCQMHFNSKFRANYTERNRCLGIQAFTTFPNRLILIYISFPDYIYFFII